MIEAAVACRHDGLGGELPGHKAHPAAVGSRMITGSCTCGLIQVLRGMQGTVITTIPHPRQGSPGNGLMRGLRGLGKDFGPPEVTAYELAILPDQIRIPGIARRRQGLLPG